MSVSKEAAAAMSSAVEAANSARRLVFSWAPERAHAGETETKLHLGTNHDSSWPLPSPTPRQDNTQEKDLNPVECSCTCGAHAQHKSVCPSLLQRPLPSLPVSCTSGQAPSSPLVHPAVEARASFIPSHASHRSTSSSQADHCSLQHSPPLSRASSADDQTQAQSTRYFSSYDKFLAARRRSKDSKPALEYDPSLNPLQQKSLLTRLTFTLNQSFGVPAAESVTVQRAQASQVEIKRATPKAKRPSLEHRLSSTASSIISFYSKDTFDSPTDPSSIPAVPNPSAALLKPFAKQRSLLKQVQTASIPAADPHLSTVQEEPVLHPEHYPGLEEQQQDEMDFVRSMTQRLSRSDSSTSLFRSPPLRQRPQISLPQLIHTTNRFVNESPPGHCHSDRSLSSTAPSTPNSDSDTPALTNSSQRSSADSTPYEGSFPEPNHLTQYFSSYAKNDESVSVMQVSPSRSIGDLAAPIPVPALPIRAASHSKREHVRLARERMRSSMVSVAASGSRASQRYSYGFEDVQHPIMADDYDGLLLDSVDEGCEEGAYKRCSTGSYLRELIDLEAARWSE